MRNTKLYYTTTDLSSLTRQHELLIFSEVFIHCFTK